MKLTELQSLKITIKLRVGVSDPTEKCSLKGLLILPFASENIIIAINPFSGEYIVGLERSRIFCQNAESADVAFRLGITQMA